MKRMVWGTLLLMGLSAASLVTYGLRQGAFDLDEEAVADSVPATRPASNFIHAEGQVVSYPGAYVHVASEAAGQIESLHVAELQKVEAGQVLATIDASEQIAAWREAATRVTEASIDVAYRHLTFKRTKRLHEGGTVTDEALDEARFVLDASEARRDVAAATARRLRTALDKYRMLAPITGTVLHRAAEVGQFTSTGAVLFTIAALDRVRIEAEVDEFDVSRVKLEAPTVVRAEGFDDRTWQGFVEEIPAEVLGRRLRPQDPGRPTDLRVLLVKVALTAPSPLKLGQRVEVRIEAEP